MRVLILANSNSIHTKRWVISLSERDIEICLFSLEKNIDRDYYLYSNIIIHDCFFLNNTSVSGKFSKLSLIKYLPKLFRVIKEFKPDLVHAHYATSYGLLGVLSGFKPFLLSVWGADVFDFPKISFVHRLMIKFIFYRSNKILSTSNIMANEINIYTNKTIEITPFGVDLLKFKKFQTETIFLPENFVIGTVKTLSSKYGIEYLIKSFKQIIDKYPDYKLKLLLIGDGEDKDELIELCNDLKISKDVVFLGNIDNSLIPKYLNLMNIYVALSTLDSESFGVAIVEASACELPVVVSNVGGLKEVVDNNVTGFVVKSKDSNDAASAIEKLLLSKKLRFEMGIAGREKVKSLYNWDENVSHVISIYKESLN
jgi:glycosyltransferase involved in cell wall biosynthesis